MSNKAPVPAARLADERSKIVDINGLKISCRLWGPDDAPALVLLHGLRGYSGTWRALAAELSSRYRLVAFDQRGRGESDWDPERNYYTDAYLSDLEDVVEHFALENFVLLGHSMGGTTSYVYAARHPEKLRGLIIEDIAPGSSIAGAGAERVVSEMASLPGHFSSWDAAREYWRARRPTIGTAAVEERVAESLRQGPDGLIEWRYDAAGIAETRIHPDPNRIVDLWPVVECLRVPTLIIRGQKSDFCPAATVEQMIGRNPVIQDVEIPGAGHYVHDDNPTAFNSAVRQFLDALALHSRACVSR